MTTFWLKFYTFFFILMASVGFPSYSSLAEPVSDALPQVNEVDSPGTKLFHDMCKKLNVSTSQQIKLDENRIKHMYAYRNLMAQIFNKRQELHNALQDSRLDIMTVTMIHKELVDLIIKQEDRHLAAILEVRKILTPEQFAQFQQVSIDQKE